MKKNMYYLIDTRTEDGLFIIEEKETKKYLDKYGEYDVLEKSNICYDLLKDFPYIIPDYFDYDLTLFPLTIIETVEHKLFLVDNLTATKSDDIGLKIFSNDTKDVLWKYNYVRFHNIIRVYQTRLNSDSQNELLLKWEYKNEIYFVEHVPNFVSGVKNYRAIYNTFEEMMEDKVIKNCLSNGLQWCYSDNDLMVIREDGTWWWVIGHVYNLDLSKYLPAFKDLMKEERE